MNVGSVTSVSLAPVIAEAAEATPLVQDGIEAAPVTTHGAEAGAAQTVSRAPAAPADTNSARMQDAPPGTESAGEFALPTAQLVPVALIGLAVDAETWWNLPRDPVEPRADKVVADDEPESAAPLDWRAVLARALREHLAAPNPPLGLQIAAEEWRRGRLVALASPRGADPAGPGWLYLVVWRRDEPVTGVRMAARMRWLMSPRENPWVHARLVKHYHPQRGRELIGPDAADDRVPCIIQLGPLMPPARSCVSVRIEEVERFWRTLDVQWSLVLVAAAQPIAGSAA